MQQTNDGSDWSYRMIIEDRKRTGPGGLLMAAEQSSSSSSRVPQRPSLITVPTSPCLRAAGYKRMAVMRRTIRVSAIVQLVYVCVRTLWHSIPFLTGGACVLRLSIRPFMLLSPCMRVHVREIEHESCLSVFSFYAWPRAGAATWFSVLH